MKSSTLENTGLGLTEELASFVHKTSYRDIAPEVIGLARGFILDGLGVIVAGSTEKGSRIVQEYVRRMGGVADAIAPRHYQSGFHSTATIGGLGAAMAIGKILRLKKEPLLRTLGIAASMASGLRENFGTMTKPLHAGRSAENGVT